MIKREITEKLKEMLQKFPVVSVTGPRQSGKSTLLKNEFSDYTYESLEDPDILLLARDDPRAFLDSYGRHIIIDEVQHCPELFSYLQTIVDETGDSGQYILSGSQNFALMAKITESLAGRVYVMTLLPFSYNEIADELTRELTTEEWIFTGGYPRIYDKNIDPADYYPSYIKTYIERDVRSLKRITDYTRFNHFIKICAARTGQVLNVSSLASDAGITTITANEWLSVLESSYIIFRLYPYYNNYGKRLIKSPKLYFYDTGLLCSLLSVRTSKALKKNSLYGQLFENMIIAEQKKQILSKSTLEDLYYWRDSNGVEVDLVQEKGLEKKISEIKSGKTLDMHYAKNLASVGTLLNIPPDRRSVIYDGEKTIQGKDAKFIPWR